MKPLTSILFLLLTNLTFGQTIKLTAPEIEKYVKSINQLKNENKLVKVSFPHKSFCGGSVDGYYLNKKPVLISAIDLGEIGFEAKRFYMNQGKFLKIIYQQSQEDFTDWEGDSIVKTAYMNTIYSITFSNPVTSHKKTNEKIIDKKVNQKQINELVACGQELELEIQTMIELVDSLKFIEKMPYICETDSCGDPLFWEVVGFGLIELLMDKLDDTTLTAAEAPLSGYHYTVADIAFNALREIIHDIPTFELLGVPFDKEGCGYCSYWRHLNENFANRQKFKAAVIKWYHKNKDNLTWVWSDHFATCDCKGKHPVGGHLQFRPVPHGVR